MSKKREFPILNGKLISDLDANGFKILGADIEVPAEKIKEAVAPELGAKADKTELETETQRAQEAEAALREAVDGKVDKEAGKGLSSNDYTNEDKAKLTGIEAGAQKNPDMSGYAKTDEVMPRKYEGYWETIADGMGLHLLRTNSTNTASFTPEGVGVGGTAYQGGQIYHNGQYLSLPSVSKDETFAVKSDVEKKVDKEAGKGLSSNDYTNEDKAKLTGIEAGAQRNPDLSGYATKDAALPRYLFTSAGISDGVVTIPPYVYAGMLSDGTAFTVAVGEGYYMRDCILIVECSDVAPTITWPANFHPRTDAETDFACVAGVNNVHVNNVYWISEYVQGEFVVAGWQETAGGSAV